MSPFITNELMILAEQVARPLRTTPRRKLRIREELLRKLSATFEDEVPASANEADALAKTREKFGDANSIRAELERSLGFVDGLFWHLSPGGEILAPKESGLRLAVRHALQAARFVLVTELIGLSLVVVFFAFVAWPVTTPAPERYLKILALTTLGIVWILAAVSTVVFLGHAMWSAFYGPNGRSPLRIMIVSALSFLVGPCMAFLGGLASPNNWESALVEALRKSPGFGAVCPFALIVLVRVIHDIATDQPARRWYQGVLVHTGWALALSLLAFLLGLALSGDLPTALENGLAIVLITAFWLMPFDLFLSAPAVIARVRRYREWESLPIEAQG